jgi:hypothetical protein
MTSTPPPPPPLSSPQTADEQRKPSFITKWLEANKESLPSVAEARRTQRQFFEKECIFPLNTPESAMADVSPMLALIKDHAQEVKKVLRGDGLVDRSSTDVNPSAPSEYRTTLDDVRQMSSLCATYKSKALVNYNEFQYKKKMRHINLQKEQQHRSTEDSASAIHTPPPYNSDYTPLKMGENFALAKIHNANYSVCLAQATCPERSRELMSCWKSLNPDVVKALSNEGFGHLICMEEKEAVERCVGAGVQRVMKDTLG